MKVFHSPAKALFVLLPVNNFTLVGNGECLDANDDDYDFMLQVGLVQIQWRVVWIIAMALMDSAKMEWDL